VIVLGRSRSVGAIAVRTPHLVVLAVVALAAAGFLLTPAAEAG